MLHRFDFSAIIIVGLQTQMPSDHNPTLLHINPKSIDQFSKLGHSNLRSKGNNLSRFTDHTIIHLNCELHDLFNCSKTVEQDVDEV
ncbi:hypothetical protein Hanom_Chr01g00077061 [Helianthus anomalus]